MSRRSTAMLALGLVAIAAVATADEVFERKTHEADHLIALIDEQALGIQALKADAAAHGQALRVSCLQTQLTAINANKKVAHEIRSLWDVGEENAEYRERSMDRLLRLELYAMLFQEEARKCADEAALAAALQRPSAVVTDAAAPSSTTLTPLAPPAPFIARPPLASPF